MADINIEDISKVISAKMEEQGMNYNKVALAAHLDYNTVRDTMEKNRVPKLETLQKILRTLGYEFTEVLDSGQNILYLSDEENLKFRKYRRLEYKYQEMIWTNIDAYLLLQEKERSEEAYKREEKKRRDHMDEETLR